MKVFVATKEKQGVRKNDFNFCNEGELLKFGFQCDGEKVDGKCGCKRSMCGFDTFKATTTFTVIDMPITKEEYINKLRESDKKAGWKFTDKESKDCAEELLDLAGSFQIGLVLEKRGNKIKVR